MRKPQGKLKNQSERQRLRRRLATRKKISGTAERPRVCLNRSAKNIRVQVVDDIAGVTLFSVQTFGKNAVTGKSDKEGAKAVGTKVAEELKAKGIESAVYDRSGYQYHGVVATLADAIRENGIRV